MKHIKYIIALFLATASLSAQEIKLKKEVVYIADTPTFSFTKKAMGNELYVYQLNTQEELLNMVVDNNKTESKVDDYKKINFAKQSTSITSKNFRSRDYEFLIALLIEEKVINTKGEINVENLLRFKAKYDDGNINKTMMR